MARRPAHKPLSTAERDARRAADRDRLEQAARALLTTDGWQRWIGVRATNGLSRYSVSNQLLIAIDCWRRGITPTYVAGFRAFLGLNRCVRRGERAIKILAPCLVKQRDESGEDSGEKRIFFRTVPVFDTLSRDRRERGQQRRRAIHGRRARLGDGSWVAGATRRVAEVAQHPAARSAVG